MNAIDPKIEAGWKEVLEPAFKTESFNNLVQFIKEEKKKYPIYPPGNLIFNAFNSTPFNEVRVVILGQDPYHGPGQAHGLSFSVPEGIRVPPSLVNIFKEIIRDTGGQLPRSGNLESWARQGVLLLNATLTVRANSPGSHQKKGWEEFTDEVIRVLNRDKENLVFHLWGNFAKKKGAFINTVRHLVLTAPHPSPLAGGGFSGCGHFSKTNNWLEEKGQKPITWL